MRNGVGQHGFTLVELLVVLGILGLIAGLGFPAVEKGLRRAAFDAAAIRIDRALRLRQAYAVRLGRIQTLSIDELRRLAEVDGSRTQIATMQIEASRSRLLFFPDGTSGGGEVLLSQGTRQSRFNIDADRPLVERR